jgi:hypothetical protein
MYLVSLSLELTLSTVIVNIRSMPHSSKHFSILFARVSPVFMVRNCTEVMDPFLQLPPSIRCAVSYSLDSDLKSMYLLSGRFYDSSKLSSFWVFLC